MKVLFDTIFLSMLLHQEDRFPLDPATTSAQVTNPKERIEYLIEALDRENAKIVVPTPALAELLAAAGADGREPNQVSLRKERGGGDAGSALRREARSEVTASFASVSRCPATDCEPREGDRSKSASEPGDRRAVRGSPRWGAACAWGRATSTGRIGGETLFPRGRAGGRRTTRHACENRSNSCTTRR